jgi:hypothetical protein
MIEVFDPPRPALRGILKDKDFGTYRHEDPPNVGSPVIDISAEADRGPSARNDTATTA